MFIAGEDVPSPTGTTLSPLSVPNGKKIPGIVRSVRQFTETASNSNTAIDMFCTVSSVRIHSIHCMVITLRKFGNADDTRTVKADTQYVRPA